MVRQLLSHVSRRGSPLVPHDRSSVRRLFPWTLVATLFASPLAAQEAPPPALVQPPRAARPRPAPDSLLLRTPAVLGALGRSLISRPDPAAMADRAVATATRRRAARLDATWRRIVTRDLTAQPVVADAGQRPAPTDSGPPPGALVPVLPAAPAARGDINARATDLFSDLGDLGLALTSRLEAKGTRNKNDRCTAAQLTVIGTDCNGTFIPYFDFQFGVRTGGVVASRVHLNVDYDSQREFDASNNISIRYQGKTDEILQTLEVGNVTFTPPVSRFLTGGIPQGNYGVQATGQLGAMRFTSIVAQQKGNVSKDNVFTVGERTEQQVNGVIEDIQFEPRRFFFTIDPRRLGGYPNIDLLNRQQMQQLASSLPDSVRPVRLYVYRQYIGAANQNPRGPQLSVRGARNPSRQVYDVLRENVDYYVDPSQLWIVLVRPVDASRERLAIAYEVNVNGVPGRNVSTGGTPDIEFTDAPQVANLLWEPELQPNNPAYFLREIKSAYRLGGEDLRRETLTLRVVTGTSGDQEKPIDASRGETYLKLFGLSQATNAATFDVENRVWPRPNDPNFRANFSGGTQQKLIDSYFAIYPSLQPFARAGLAQPLANPANDTLYAFPNEYVYSPQRPQAIFRMITSYQATGASGVSTIKLASMQVRQNSERVVLEGVVLEKEKDYTIDYDIGLITFARPDTLFSRPRQVNVRYEENPIFVGAPTTILGFASQFPLDNGQLAFTAISQQQRTTLNRPPLGFEPVGSLVAGVSGQMQWDATRLTAAIAKLPFSRTNTPSRIGLQAEFAMSKPQPNAAGQAYVESFEGGSSEQAVPMLEGAWYYSSLPALGNTFGSTGSSILSLPRAATLAFQNNGVDNAGGYPQFTLQQIDPAVTIQGAGVQSVETLLWMTLYPLRTGGVYDFVPGTPNRRFAWTVGDNSLMGATPTGRRWRSVRTALNPSGLDLSRTESIEFFVLVNSEAAKRRKNPTLVFDFGDISENSVSFAPETLTVNAPARAGFTPDTTYRGKRLVGFDRFDSERDRVSRAFNAVENDKGIGGDVADTIVVVDRTSGQPVTTTQFGIPLCTQSTRVVQVLGDSRANCTTRNNKLDEEDIDLDGQLNMASTSGAQESIKRFVVDLSDTRNWTRVGRCYQQSDSTTAGVTTDSLCWVQVKLNWRAPAEELNAPNDRRMRAMRMTMLSSAQAADDEFARIALTRFRLAWAPWLKRSVEPLSGMAGDSSGVVGGYVVASVVGTLDSTAAVPYSAPPGVAEVPENKRSGYESAPVQVNERSLRLQTGLPGREFRTFDRAEAFYRFPNGTQTFMGYRTMRVWMRGRGHGWGPSGELNGYVKIGRDENNFYMYRTPVNTGESQSAWLPEVNIDLTRFQALRARLENEFLKGGKDSVQCSGADLELIKRSGKPRGVAVRRYAVCEDGYIVYSADPAVTPPNLAGVQEVAVGLVRVDSIARSATAIMPNDTLELWVDDVRLFDVVDDIGFAGEVGLSVNAGDLADVRIGLSRRDPNFRQLNEAPSFLTQSGVSVGTTLHLERMLPQRLGLVMPLRIDYAGSGVQQMFINRTDVRADGIEGLRNPRDSRTTYSLALRRAVPLDNGWYAPLVNGLSLNGSWSNAASQSAFQELASSSYLVGGGLALGGETRESALPGALGWFLDRLPSKLRRSAAVEQMRQTKFRWAPSQFRLASSLARTSNSATSFTKAAENPLDTGQVVTGLTHAWQNQGTLEFRPTASLQATMNARQLLDLRDYRTGDLLPDSTDRGQAAAAERLRFAGTTLGLERERSLTSAFQFAPTISLWLRPRYDFTSSFTLSKDPNARQLLRADDTTGTFRLPRRLGASQVSSFATSVDFNRFMTMRTKDGSKLRRVGALFAPIDINWQQSLTSNYDNTSYIPGWGYQLGLGDVSAYRGLDSRLATTAGRMRRTTFSGALNLPFSLIVQSRLEQGTTETWTRRTLDGFQAVILSSQQVRPDFSVRWNWRPNRLKRVITLLNLNGRYVVTEQETSVPNETGGLADRSRAITRGRPISASITWKLFGELTTNAQIDRQKREDLRPGARTDGDTKRLSFDVARNFRLPKSWNTRTGMMRTSLSYQSEENSSVVAGSTVTDLLGNVSTTAPSVLTNNGRRAINLNGSTDLSDLLRFNLTASHVVNFDRNYNRQTSNLILSAVLSLQFYAGDLK